MPSAVTNILGSMLMVTGSLKLCLASLQFCLPCSGTMSQCANLCCVGFVAMALRLLLRVRGPV